MREFGKIKEEQEREEKIRESRKIGEEEKM